MPTEELIIAKKRKPVKVWRADGGIVHEIKVGKLVFALRSDMPEHIDPIRVAEAFASVIDIEKSENLNAENAGNEQSTKSARGNVEEDGAPIAKEGIIAIYPDRVIDIWNRYVGREFTSTDITAYLKGYYGDKIKKGTAYNKQRGYIKYMLDQGFIKVVDTIGKIKVYKFVTKPYVTGSSQDDCAD